VIYTDEGKPGWLVEHEYEAIWQLTDFQPVDACLHPKTAGAEVAR
jgi:hypothetical protein